MSCTQFPCLHKGPPPHPPANNKETARGRGSGTDARGQLLQRDSETSQRHRRSEVCGLVQGEYSAGEGSGSNHNRLVVPTVVSMRWLSGGKTSMATVLLAQPRFHPILLKHIVSPAVSGCHDNPEGGPVYLGQKGYEAPSPLERLG